MEKNEFKKAAKPTTANRKNRIKAVYQLLMDGKSRPVILEYCSKIHALKRAAADSLIQEASRQIEEDICQVRASRFAVLLQRLSDLYERTLATNNYAVARQIIMDEVKLLGLDNHGKTLVIENKCEFSEMSSEELDVIIAAHGGSHQYMGLK